VALFKRKKNESVLPEVDEYYKAERSDRGWLAWVLALVSVLVVVAAVIALFLGGRWVWNQLTEDEQAGEVGVRQNDVGQEVTVDGDPNRVNEQPVAGNEQPAPSTNEGTVNAPTQTNPRPTTGTGGASTQTPAPTTTPRTGDAPLPSTGPASLLTTFVGVTGLAGSVHYLIERRKR
jgi:cytoskeletal protein RodZ